MCGSYEYYGIIPETHNREKWREGEREGGRRRRRRRESKREGGRKRRKREARVLVLTSNELRVSYSLQK